MASLALKIGHQVRLKSAEALEYGYRQLGFDQNIAYFKAKSFISNDFREQEERELQLARRKLREERELADSPFRKLARSLDKTFTRWGENVFSGVANWYAGWSKRSAMNADGNFRVGGGMPNSPDWQSRVNIDTSFPTPQKGPTPHPVENLEALAAPAEKALSGGDTGKVAWSKKDGTKYGLFAFTPERMQEFADWMKTRGSEGQYWAKEFEEAGGFKNFISADEAKNSKIAEVMARFGANERTQAQLRKYVYEKYYQPSLEAMEPAKRAELMASEAGQKMLYMEAAQGEVIIDKSGGGFDPNVKIGDTIAHEESGIEGVYKIGHDRTGGTSYGKWQLSSTNAKGGEGSYQGWLRFLDQKGGKWAGVASRLRSAGPLNTGSRRGAAVDAYKAELKGNEREIEELQREYLLEATAKS